MAEKFKMARKRYDWAKNRNVVMRGEPLRPNERAMERKAAEVTSMVTKMHRDVSKELMVLFNSGLAKEYAEDASITSQATVLLNKKAREWQQKFNSFSRGWSNSMIEGVTKSASKDLNNSLEKLSGGMSIDTSTMSSRTKDIAKASAEQSASLIKTISSSYIDSVKESVMRSITDGSMSFTALKGSIQDALVGRYRVEKNKAKNVALDQTRKAYNSIATQKMRDTGITKFEWLHVSGSKQPRSYHRDILNGKVFDIDSPPIIDQKTGERGLPGDAINCKCVKIPVVEFGN